MRILLCNTYYPPYRGGAEAYVSNLAASLVRLDHSVKVVCTSGPDPPGHYLDREVEVVKLPFVARFYGTPLPRSLLPRLLETDADIMHACFPNPYFASSVAFAATARRRPAVITWFNDLPPVTFGAGVVARVHDYALSPPYLSRFKRIIALSQHYATTSRILRRHLNKVIVIPPGVDTKRFNQQISADEVTDRLRLGGNEVVLFVGALTKWHRYKGLDILIRAFKTVHAARQNTRVLVVGDGSLRPYYETLTTALALQDFVIFAGDVSDEELPKYYASCSVFVLPSLDRSEGFGIVLLEAMASGKPVTGSRVGGIPDAIRHGETGLLVNPNDQQKLAETILRLLSDEKLRTEMGREGRKHAEKHDWSIIARRIERLYEEVLA